MQKSHRCPREKVVENLPTSVTGVFQKKRINNVPVFLTGNYFAIIQSVRLLLPEISITAKALPHTTLVNRLP
jgi:hypothetical protein